MKQRQNKLVFIFFLLTFFLMLFSLSQGAFPIEPTQVLKILANQVYTLNHSWAAEDELILLHVRLPRIILVILVGANLAVSGTILQAIFKNPLVSPFILGISSGASLGASIVIVFFNFCGFYFLQLSAFAFSIVAVLMVLLIARISNSRNIAILVLSGVVTTSLFQAIVSLLQYFSEADKLQSIVYWNFGSFANASWKSVLQVAPFTAIGIIFLFLSSWRINVLSLGDEESTALGLNTERYRFGIIMIVSLLTSTVTAVTGPIGWVGLIIPHIVRMLIGSNNYFVILGSIGLGSAFMLLVDFVARTAFNFEVPVGIVTSIIGVPFLFTFFTEPTNKFKMIDINNLKLELSNKVILENLNFSISTGIFAILGLNGCGKTTLLKSLMGLLKLKAGNIKINNTDISDIAKNELAKKIAFVPQEHSIYFNYTVSEMVLMGRTPHIKNFALPKKSDDELVDKALNEIEILHLKNRNFLELSGGERRLVLIARALAQQTEIILFDEPTTFLDLKNSYLVINIIKKLAHEKLVILTLHDLNQTLQCADNILMIFGSDDHKFGKIEDMITDENLNKLYNLPLEIVKNGNKIQFIRTK